MSKGSYIVGIAGGSGSGKTSFVNALKEQFKGNSLCFISLDDYYLPREEQHTDANGIKNFDLPSSISYKELVKDIETLKRGEVVAKSKYTFNNANAEAESVEFVPAPLIIIEGLFIYHYEELKEFFDLKIFIDARDELKLIRRINRDEKERNYPYEDVVYRYEHHVMPSYRDYIGKYKDEVDIVINNNQSFDKGLKVVSAFLSHQLKDLG